MTLEWQENLDPLFAMQCNPRICHKLQCPNMRGNETIIVYHTFLAWHISQVLLVPYHLRWHRHGKQYHTFIWNAGGVLNWTAKNMRGLQPNFTHSTFLAWHLSQTLLVSKTVEWHWHCYAGYVMNCSGTAVLLHKMTHFSDLVSQETSSCLALSGILLSQSYRQCV